MSNYFIQRSYFVAVCVCDRIHTQAITPIIVVDSGKDTIHTKANFQPLINAIIIPETKVDSKKIKMPIFSPMPSSIFEIFLQTKHLLFSYLFKYTIIRYCDCTCLKQ